MDEVRKCHHTALSTQLILLNSGPPRGRESRILQWVLVLGLCALLIFAVLAFGAVEEWSTFAFEAGAAALFLVWAGKQFVSGQLKLSKNPLYPPAFLFFGLILAQVALRRSAYGYVTEIRSTSSTSPTGSCCLLQPNASERKHTRKTIRPGNDRLRRPLRIFCARSSS